MGERQQKFFVIISGFTVNDNNRGTAALSYGSIPFMEDKGWLCEGQTLLNYRFVKNLFKKENRGVKENIVVAGGKEWTHLTINVPVWEKWLFDRCNIRIPFTKFGKTIKQVSFVAAINGGDGFSDIYGTYIFYSRLPETLLAIKFNIPFVLLPQTIGPFNKAGNKKLAHGILKKALKVYTRDREYEDELKKLHINYEETEDLSFYMQPEPWDVEIKAHPVGLNISGLAYFNHFANLSSQFAYYPELIVRIIQLFQEKRCTVYLIPHSYNIRRPEANNDDMLACQEVYENLQNRNGVILINKNLSSPQVKYLISKMSFFVGTRMHANFAAIYTHVPAFGLAYSYKFKGAFEANGLVNSTAMISNLKPQDLDSIVALINQKYSATKQHE